MLSLGMVATARDALGPGFHVDWDPTGLRLCIVRLSDGTRAELAELGLQRCHSLEGHTGFLAMLLQPFTDYDGAHSGDTPSHWMAL